MAEYTTEATDYVKGYKALDWLLECVGDALLDEPPAARAATLAGDAPSSSPPTADDPRCDEKVANRDISYGLARRDRKWSLNDGRI